MTMKTCNFRRFAVSDINIAFNQTTYMSSENGKRISSDRAVDGDLSTTLARCSVTASENKPWWAVKLRRDDNIAKVVVTNRDTNGRKEL